MQVKRFTCLILYGSYYDSHILWRKKLRLKKKKKVFAHDPLQASGNTRIYFPLSDFRQDYNDHWIGWTFARHLHFPKCFLLGLFLILKQLYEESTGLGRLWNWLKVTQSVANKAETWAYNFRFISCTHSQCLSTWGCLFSFIMIQALEVRGSIAIWFQVEQRVWIDSPLP